MKSLTSPFGLSNPWPSFSEIKNEIFSAKTYNLIYVVKYAFYATCFVHFFVKLGVVFCVPGAALCCEGLQPRKLTFLNSCQPHPHSPTTTPPAPSSS